MADFFIRRPIVAIVIAILTVMLGLVTIRGLSVEQYPFLAPPNIRVTADLPGRLGRGGGAVGGHADRAGGQRRRPADLHEIVEHQRRPHAARRQLRGRHRPGHRQRADAEPRLGGAGAVAGRSHAAGRDGQEAEPQHPDADLDLLADRFLRRQLPDQLRRHQPARPVAAHPGHRPGRPVRRHRLRHAHLVPARPAGQAGPDPGRRDQRDQGAEPAGAHRQGRRRADAEGPAVHQHGQRAGPAGHAARSSRTSSCARARPARWCASRTSAAPNSARRTTTPSAG